MIKSINPLTGLSRILAALGGVALIAVLFLPIWRIELDAPQYPEGLCLQIYPNKLGGDVEIVNGLNHYIGMKTLHAENFIEFTVLPYLIGSFAVLFLAVATVGRKRPLQILFFAFTAFCLVAMADFWRWEYDYGHDLDPNAAIQIPGMAYQPPLIGFKQLLNFGAYSIPDTGGWIFIGAACLLASAFLYEWRLSKRLRMNSGLAPVVIILISLTSCSNIPDPIKIGRDQCAHCKMTITDPRFACELVTDKNKVYKFDDVLCVRDFVQDKRVERTAVRTIYVCDYMNENAFLDVNTCFLFQSIHLRSPMNGNVAAFGSEADMLRFNETTSGIRITWDEYFH